MKNNFKVFAASTIGITIEFFDFSIFMLFAVYLSKNYFNNELSESFKLLQVYATFAVGYLLRPVGGIVLGHVSDKYGRKKSFFISIIIMAFATLGIGFLPSYDLLGRTSIILLVIFRMAQGFSTGGELPAGTVFIYEHIKEKYRGLGVAIVSCGNVFGVLLASIFASIIFAVFSEEQVLKYAWRIPFIFGGCLALFGFYIRSNLSETPVFKNLAKEKIKKVPLLTLLKKHKLDTFYGLILVLFAMGSGTVFTIYLPSYLKVSLHYSNQLIFLGNSLGLVFAILLKLMYGYLSDKINIKKLLLLYVTMNIVISAVAFPILLTHNTTLFLILSFLFSTCIGGNILVSLEIVKSMPTAIRVSGYGVCLNIALIFIGLLPAVSTLLNNIFNIQYSMFIIIGLINIIGFTTIILYPQLNKEKKDTL